MVLVPQPYGEVVDRLVILALKCDRIADPARREQARAFHDALVARWAAAALPALTDLPELPRLRAVNAELWDVEDELRACERRGVFDDRFVALARRVYQANDERSALKAEIDRRLGSPFVDPKDHSGRSGRGRIPE